MKGWRVSESGCTENRIVVKCEYVSSETYKCRLYNQGESKSPVYRVRYPPRRRLTTEQKEDIDVVSIMHTSMRYDRPPCEYIV